MIRDGKASGWLQLPPEVFLAWAKANDVVFQGVTPGTAAGKGAALLATDLIPTAGHEEGLQTLMTVPRDLILSAERVYEHAKIDKDFREALESIGDVGRAPRGAILLFLLVQASVSCPQLLERVSVHTAFTDYVKFLPSELLPTFWTQDELKLLVGTTLAPAVSSKLRSLRREYDHVCDSIARTRWFQAVCPFLDFDDWLQVDAMYRSRALDFPGIGHCMVPCVDLANHAAGDSTTAIYEKDTAGNAVLQLRRGVHLTAGNEVTITYGDEKGACEMLFSYGFLEPDRMSAETLFLSLIVPDSDPLRHMKMKMADCAPGFKLIDTGDGQIDWKGDFIWLLCVNADDGLRFELARTVDGAEEVHAFFQDQKLTGGAAQLHSVLGTSGLWDVYRLRAVAILQRRIFDQLKILHDSQDDVENTEHGGNTAIRDRIFEQAKQLRRLEFELLELAYEDFERQKLELAESSVVQQYLAEMTSSSNK